MTAGGARTFARRIDNAALTDLPEIVATVVAACEAAAVPDALRSDLRLAVEEAYTNIVRHGYGIGGTGPITLVVTVSPDAVTVRLEDEAPAFQPESVATPGLADHWSKREIGGLGWHLITQVMDEVRHTPRSPVGNILTLTKRLPAGHRDGS